MSYPVYQVPSGDVLPIMFSTFDGGTGASITMTGLAVTDIEIYKDGSVTQRASDAGYTLLDTDGIDFDGLTGIHGFSIDTGDNTDAGFYTVGAWFHVVVSAITVDAQTVSFVAAAFRLMAAEGVAGVPDVNTTHVSDTAQTANDVGADVNEILTDTGTTIPATLGTPAGASLAADIAAIEAQTDDIGAAGAGLTAVPWNAAWDAEVQSEVQDAIEANNLDHVVGTATAIPAIVAGTYLDQMMDDGTAVFDRTTDSLQAIRDHATTIKTETASILTDTAEIGAAGAGLSAIPWNAAWDAEVQSEVADAVDAAIPAVPTAGSINDVLKDLDARLPASGTISTLTAANINTEVVDALNVDTYAEPGQGAPAATATLAAKVGYLYKAWRNKKDNDGTTTNLYADDATTVDQKQATSEAAGTVTKGEWATGP